MTATNRRAFLLTTGTALLTAADALAQPEGRPIRITVLGDSLSAGTGLPAGESFPDRMREIAAAEQLDVEITVVARSGWRSSDGPPAMRDVLALGPDILVQALGANDGLRRLDTTRMAHNLLKVVDTAHSRRITVVLAGMEAPPGHGAAYAAAFRNAYQRIAADRRTWFVPFLLAGVAMRPEMNQPDGIHPNRNGALQVAYNVWPTVAELVRAIHRHR